MKVYYSLDQEDYLQHQLYVCNTTPSIIKKRKANWFWLTFLFFAFAVIFFLLENQHLALFSFFMGLLVILFYPMFERKKYFNYYNKYIKAHYPKKASDIAYIEFQSTYLLANNPHSELKIDYTAIEKIVEIKEYIFIRLNFTSSLIIPKNKIENLEEIKNYIIELSRKLNKEYSEELHWNWR
jgi:hypothetical protein